MFNQHADTEEAGVRPKRYPLNDIAAPFVAQLLSRYGNITPAELQVAWLIKKGKNTNEITKILNLSVKTIEFHRFNLRRKIGITNKKADIKSYVMDIGG